ncbi:hypothetical protein QJQ45_014851 [Haematococcus lacustris]|nr:hypothetical protein QJQ45_014851 [Haematococcus lacustris]
MHRASRLELGFHASIVAVLQLIVLRDAILLSDSAAAAITSAAGSAQLPYRLPSILSLPSPDRAAYLNSQSTLQQQQQQSSWAYWRHKLPAILLGRSARDVSDVQWREFRGSLGRLAAGLGLWAMASRWVRAAGGPSPHLAYLLLTSLLMLGGLHGATSMWVLLLLGCSFLVSRVAAGRAYGPLLLWSWHLGALVAVRGTQGFRGLHPGLTWMEQQGGPLRWHIHYNLLLLRMLSYGMDLHWAVRSASAPAAAPDTPATAAAAMPASTPPAPSTAAAAAPHTPLRAPLVASAAAPGSGGGVGGVRRRHPVPPLPGADPSATALQAKVCVPAYPHRPSPPLMLAEAGVKPLTAPHGSV